MGWSGCERSAMPAWPGTRSWSARARTRGRRCPGAVRSLRLARCASIREAQDVLAAVGRPELTAVLHQLAVAREQRTAQSASAADTRRAPRGFGRERTRLRRPSRRPLLGTLASRPPAREVLVREQSNHISVLVLSEVDGVQMLVRDDHLVVAVDMVLVRAFGTPTRRRVSSLVDLVGSFSPKKAHASFGRASWSPAWPASAGSRQSRTEFGVFMSARLTAKREPEMRKLTQDALSSRLCSTSRSRRLSVAASRRCHASDGTVKVSLPMLPPLISRNVLPLACASSSCRRLAQKVIPEHRVLGLIEDQ